MTSYFNDITDHLFGNYEDKITYFRIINRFNLPVGYPTSYFDVDNGPHITFNKGDIIGCGSMKFIDTDKQLKQTNLVFFNGERHPFSLSKEFFDINNILFQDITTQFLRDYKINKIIK